ncbi:MAG: hypothetical protein AB1734_02130 [Elusimicrobiota bacterium]
MILAGALMLLSYPVRAEISAAVVTDRILIQLSSDGTYSHSVSSGTCSTPDCSLSITLVDTISYGPYYEGAGSASKTNVSGNLRRFYNDMNVNGTNNVESKSRVYAKVPPGQPVIIKVPASAHVAWNNMSYIYGGPILTAWAVAELTNPQMTVANSTGASSNVSLPTSSDSQSKTLAIEATATGEPVSIGGEDYYLVGRINLRGRIHIRRYGGPSPDASFSASVGQPEVRYKGKVLKYESGGGQTWLVGQPLPAQLAVRVTQDDTGQPVPGETITFQIQAPANGAILGAVTAATDADGIARTTLTLGSSPGIYTVNATCPGCVAAASAVNFTATAKTNEEVTELSLVQCDKYAGINSRVNNAFIVRAFNTLTRAGEPGLDIAFSASAAPPGASGQQAMPGSVQTNDLGIAFVSVWTGDKTGPYTYTAECPSCGQKPDAQCALSAGLPPSMAAEPEDVGPVAGNPDVTPMLRISNIGYPNDGVSFTTLFGENKINLAADLKPDTPEYNALSEDIAWEVVDSPADAMDSGNPAPPANGAATYFHTSHPPIPAAPTGRQFPLKYKIQASVVTPKGLIKSYPRHIRQDDIDKCRQEYIDFEVPIAEVPRSTFTPGIDSEFLEQKDRGSCHAYIYPAAEAQKVNDLRATGYKPRVTSGYRSPLRQFELYGSKIEKRDKVKNSTHIYGQAVDIAPQWTDKNAAGWKALWTAPAATCPKSLELSPTRVMLWCKGAETEPYEAGSFPKGVTPENFDTMVYGRATCIHLGNPSK